METRMYLAGPFFNHEQKLHMQMIEQTLKRNHIQFFSPRIEGGTLKPKASEGARMAILDMNVKGILESTCVLAVLDWLNPSGCEVRLIKSEERQLGYSHSTHYKSPPLNMPDTGTVWELGYAYGTKVPVVGFLLERTGKFNVMLTEAMRGICYGFHQLDSFLYLFNRGGLNARTQKEIESWRGETT